eukprot:CAMPEP_0197277326 /NCGR_PEP_ID=MMETSP1432-20130617/16922_1 /TAXON_ID=44447 /ORGANISM="Pseudo-nitzschia delicatissima, Strain UNC1205" /LENGTH=371 /DNA_ID=CAMNT_0042743507 /DNA_START=172 /DNA_END=1284 /DNA_ORIENTATION=-
MQTNQEDLRRPLLQEEEVDEERAAAILDQWNASVAAFVADDGGEDNVSCTITESELNTTNTDDDDDGNGDEEEDEQLVANVWRTKLAKICTSTLLPEDVLMTAEEEEEEDNDHSKSYRATIKFLKFVVITIAAIALVRTAVARIDDRDQTLTLAEIALYEGDSILRDLLFFFVVGRMQQRSGVDTIEWIGFGVLANLYFESQTLFEWMQHSATPYEMHCLWPWQLWVFAILVVIVSVGLGIAHAVVAHRDGKLGRMLIEILFCVSAFIVPVSFSPYAHFHHWFAGWFLGMHANLHTKWWSRATMAYCWGMYVNGIAVYGRDPLLVCDYARFIARDQKCPMPIDDYESAAWTTTTMNPLFFFFFFTDDPPDW